MEADNDISDTEVNSFGEEDDLIISRFLNLDEDSLEEDSAEEEDNQNLVEKEKETDIEWDPIAAADDI
ncbi:15036_t:CDS:2, partial [Funneliformis mosseae]